MDAKLITAGPIVFRDTEYLQGQALFYNSMPNKFLLLSVDRLSDIDIDPDAVKFKVSVGDDKYLVTASGNFNVIK